jgi:hypothetical protein
MLNFCRHAESAVPKRWPREDASFVRNRLDAAAILPYSTGATSMSWLLQVNDVMQATVIGRWARLLMAHAKHNHRSGTRTPLAAASPRRLPQSSA